MKTPKYVKIKYMNGDVETIELLKKWNRYSLTDTILVLYGEKKIKNIPLHNIEAFVAEEE